MDQTTTTQSEAAHRHGNADDHEYDAYLARLQARFLMNTRIGERPLFTTGATGLFQAYLDAFPADVRKYHDCHACRDFIERYGGLVTIEADGRTMPAFWHEEDAGADYKPSVAALARVVRRSLVTGVFLSREPTWGKPVTGIWHHVSITPPPRYIGGTEAMAEKRMEHANLCRALAEYRIEHVKQAVTLLKTKSLYGSEKVLGQAEWLLALHEARAVALGGTARSNVVWLAIARAPAGFCHPRSSMIGTLLDDLSSGVAFETAQRNFAAKMDPLQYQRAQVAPTAGNVAQAEKLFAELGLAPALRRRFARLEEVVHAAIWVPVAAPPKPAGGVFSHLVPGAKVEPVNVPTTVISWEKFARSVLPGAESVELLIEPGYYNSFGALVTAVDPEAPPLLQWDIPTQRNPVCWYMYAKGSPPERWSLTGGWARVTAIVRQPNLWHRPDDFAHHGRGVVLLLEGARDTASEQLALFPNQLRSELHGVRATIEAFSKAGKLEGADQASACGLFLQEQAAYRATVRVKVGDVQLSYRLDRWS